MILVKTPYRISFFGGGSDYPQWYNKYEGEVVSTTIDKFVYLNIKNLPKFFNHNYRVSYSKIEEVKKISEIKHNAVRAALKYKKIKDFIEIHYAGDLPARSGMGSSSSFVVGLLNALNFFKNNKLSKNNLAKESIFFEQKILNEVVGCQDQIASAYGGFNFIKFKKNKFLLNSFNNEKIKKKLNDNLVLLYTGKQRFAHEIARKFVNKLTSSKKKEILNILNLVKLSKKILKSGNLNEFGLLLDESWSIKKSLDRSISNSVLEHIYSKGKDCGAIGGKLLGAGAGGFFLFYVPIEKKKYFVKKMSPLVNIPFKFSNIGSSIIKI